MGNCVFVFDKLGLSFKLHNLIVCDKLGIFLNGTV